jgi:hypothetical protein
MTLTKATYSLIDGAPVNVLDYGAVGDGVANDTAALNAALAVAVANNRCLYIPAGTYLATANIVVPTPSNVQRGFTIMGEGKHSGSIIKFSGAAVTTGLTFTSGVGVYQYWGTVSELMFSCVGGAKRGMTFTYAHAPILTNLHFNGGTEPGLVLENCNQPVVEKCLFLNNGSSGTAQLKMDYCTAFTLSDNYVAGSATAVAGIDIDRSNTGIITGGAIESTGTSIRLCEAVDGTVGCNDITIQSVNMENTTNSYIRMGYGWTSTYGVRNITLSSCRGYVSGSATALIGVDMKNCLGVDIISCQFALTAGGTASHNLFGTTNAGIFVGKNRESYGVAIPWVRANSVAIIGATPITDWSSDFAVNQMIYASVSPTTSTLNNALFAGQGGLNNVILLGNAGATTINRTSAIPELNGTTLTLIAADANTTIAHLGGGGTGQFRNFSGANIALASGQALSYVYNANTGNWSQV